MDNAQYKTIVRKGFDQASEGYDHPPMCFFDRGAARLVALSRLRGHEKILDIATGTGKVALAAAQHLSHGHVTGMDLSDGMLQRAGDKVKSAGLTNVEFKCVDVDDVELPESCYDGVFCGFGLFFFMDMKSVLKKIHRTLKPGGFVGITSFADGSFVPLSNLTLDRFRAYGLKMPETYSWQRLDSHEKHDEILETAGFQRIRTQTESMGYYLKTPDEWWEIVTYTGFRSFLNQMTPQQAAQYKDELHQEVADTADMQGIRLNVDVIFSTAYRE